MNAILIFILKLVSKSPNWLLYLLSDLLYLIGYKIIRYRKDVVIQNLKNSFPKKTDLEIKTITKKFYKSLFDVFIEIIKSFSFNKEEYLKKTKVQNIEILDNLYKKNKNVIIIGAHYSNWEYCSYCVSIYSQYKILNIYKNIKNKSIDTFVRKAREKFGAELYPMQSIYRKILDVKKQFALGLLGDQTPPPENSFWMRFLNQNTPVFNGFEKIAKKTNSAVVFLYCKPYKRGHYEMKLKLITEDVNNLPSGEIVEKYMKILENIIIETPHYWLWSHKRWKHNLPQSISHSNLSKNFPVIQ